MCVSILVFPVSLQLLRGRPLHLLPFRQSTLEQPRVLANHTTVCADQSHTSSTISTINKTDSREKVVTTRHQTYAAVGPRNQGPQRVRQIHDRRAEVLGPVQAVRPTPPQANPGRRPGVQGVQDALQVLVLRATTIRNAIQQLHQRVPVDRRLQQLEGLLTVLTGEIAGHQTLLQRFRQLTDPRLAAPRLDPEAGLPNPPPPYAPRPTGPTWNSAQGLWRGYKEDVQKTAQRLGLRAPELKDLSQY